MGECHCGYAGCTGDDETRAALAAELAQLRQERDAAVVDRERVYSLLLKERQRATDLYVEMNAAREALRTARAEGFREGMKRALRLVSYHRGIPGGEPLPAYLAALDRVENSIKTELENGGPMISHHPQGDGQ